jgi:hypothetical protein
MARNNPKPSEKIDWQAIGQIIVPSAARKLAGWLFSIKPPAQNFNWKWNLDSLQQLYSNAQVEDWIVIDSDADEGDYATLAAYIADAPAAGNRILVKEDQTVTAQVVLPANVTLKFLDGSRLLCATNIATSVLKLGSNPIIEGVLNIVLSQTGVTAKAVEIDGDNATGKINVENSSTGTLTTGYHINANKTGNKIEGFAQNTGGGTLTNVIVDNSTELSNIMLIVDESNSVIITANIATTETSQEFKNKKLQDSTTSIVDNSDNTKELKFDVANITTGTTREITVPDADMEFDFGTYTPVATSVLNLDATPTVFDAQYIRVGNIVTVSGVLSINPTTTLTTTAFRLTLPIASALTNASQLAGTFVWDGGGGNEFSPFVIQGDSVTDEAAFTGRPVGVISSSLCGYTYTYQIL